MPPKTPNIPRTKRPAKPKTKKQAPAPAKKSKQGGKREGAGRKPVFGETMITRSITMLPASWEKVSLEAEKQSVSQGNIIQQLVMEKL
jgi:hypothetical protein